MAKKKNTKYVYFFGGKKADGKAEMKNLLGGKGANLAEMVNIGLPVPAGFTITTDVCTYFYANKKKYPKELEKQVLASIKKIEKVMGAKFGDKKNPLLLSVRSGARASMPGMMDTILNLGLNDVTVEGLLKEQIIQDLLMILTEDLFKCMEMLYLVYNLKINMILIHLK